MAVLTDHNRPQRPMYGGRAHARVLARQTDVPQGTVHRVLGGGDHHGHRPDRVHGEPAEGSAAHRGADSLGLGRDAVHLRRRGERQGHVPAVRPDGLRHPARHGRVPGAGLLHGVLPPPRRIPVRALCGRGLRRKRRRPDRRAARRHQGDGQGRLPRRHRAGRGHRRLHRRVGGRVQGQRRLPGGLSGQRQPGDGLGRRRDPRG